MLGGFARLIYHWVIVAALSITIAFIKEKERSESKTNTE